MTNSESRTSPRRPDGARICPSCLQEFPQGRGYAEHDCPDWQQPQPAPSAENVYPDTGNAKVDVDGILARTGDVVDDVRELLLEAWYFGYTNGMADAAKLEAKAKTWNPMKQAFE